MSDFSFPEFRDQDNGGVYVWDAESSTYVWKPNAGLEQDRGHSTGGDNDLFNQNQIEHSELAGSPETEGYMAHVADFDMGFPGLKQRPWEDNCPKCRGTIQTKGNLHQCRKCGFSWGDQPAEPALADNVPGDLTLNDIGIPPEGEDYYRTARQGEFAPKGQVKCPLCTEITDQPECPVCHKDLTPEWNNENASNNEFFGTPDVHNDASEFQSWPQRVPKRNREKTDDSYPSMNLSSWEWAKLARTVTADQWDDMIAGDAPVKTEVGKWLVDKQGGLHYWQGRDAYHEKIAERDGLAYPGDVGALGSVYNDGQADVQKVFPGFQFDQQSVQALLEQAFGPVQLQGQIGANGTQTKGIAFEPFAVHGGQWIVNPQHKMMPLTGLAWVKERPEGQTYKPNMILVAEHLQPEDFEHWAQGCAGIITATGGLTSHAAYLAMTQGIPVIVGIGEPYNNLETGDYLKIEPETETITVMPGATGSMSPEQKHQISDTYMQYQRARGGSVKPESFAHFNDELAWREANTPTLSECPECRDPMSDQDGESVCHSCGHKQPIITHEAAAPQLEITSRVESLPHTAKGENVDALIITASIGDLKVGQLIAEPYADSYRTDYIEVLPEYRRMGIGTALARAGYVEHNLVRYTTTPDQIYQSPEGRALAAKVGGITPGWHNAMIKTAGPALIEAAPLAEGLMGGGAAAGGAGAMGAGETAGLPGIGQLMNKALQGGAFQSGKGLAPGSPSPQGEGGSAPADPSQYDTGAENAGIVSNYHTSGAISGLIQAILNGAKSVGGQFFDASSPLAYVDDAAGVLMGAGHQVQQTTPDPMPGGTMASTAKNALWSFGGTFGEDEVGNATKNRGDNSTEDADSGGIEGKKEQGDGPEQLKDVDGAGDAKGDAFPEDDLAAQGDPAMQEKALKTLHLNLPLVLEFANSDEPGAEHPIMQAIDALLEEAFPGYKDGTGQGEDEHPVEEINVEIPSNDGEPKEDPSEDESGEEPADGDEKDKKDPKQASVWHFADLEDHTADISPWGTPGMPAQMPQTQTPGVPGATGVPTCPMCGQSHLPGTPCPTDPSAVTAPTAQGAPITPVMPNKVVTKWQVVALNDYEVGRDWGTHTCPSCGEGFINGVCPTCQGQPTGPAIRQTLDEPTQWGGVPDPRLKMINGSAAPGIDDPGFQQFLSDKQLSGAPMAQLTWGELYDEYLATQQQQGQQADPRLQNLGAVDNEFAFFMAADEGEHHSEHSEHDDSPWQDETGSPLQQGAQYELKSSAYAIPDRITVDHVLPEKLVYTTDSGEVKYRNEITAQDVATNDYTFAPVGLDDSPVDSADGFQDVEAPVRPGQDASPQVDDLSTPQTVVSRSEGLEDYMGSYAGDAPDDRSWLMAEGSSEVEVDPTLMAKLAGKDFSAREQREFIDEKGEARNLDRLDLDGTHYVEDDGYGDTLW